MLLLPLFLSCWIVTGLAAEAPTVEYYRRTNSSVCLHVTTPPPYTDGSWKKEKTIVSPTFLNPNYKKRVVFSRENLSLCINELTDSDSGVYGVSFTDSNYSSVTETHHVTVEGLVPRPVVAVHASNQSAGSCKITVNCSIQNDWATSHCDADGCKASQTSTRTFNISIFTEKRTAVCRGNNHVSTNQGFVNIDDCFSQQIKPQEHAISHHVILILIVVGLTLCVCVCGFVLCLPLRHYRHLQTPPAPPIEGQPEQTPSQGEAGVSTPSSSEAEPCYENTRQPGPTGSPTQQPGSLESPTTDTIYAFPNVPASAGSKGTGQENRPSTSQSVTGHETQPPEVDTVYCLLQMPGK